MDLISKKFKYLFDAQSILKDETVPSFVKITRADESVSISNSSILRSSVKGEAEESNLLSGRSQSISNIKSREDFKKAYLQILQQSDIEEVILQYEILWNKHLTLIHEKDFIFVEIKIRGNEEDKPQFLYWTPIGHTTDSSGLLKSLNLLLNRLKPLTDSQPLWLMELGLRNEDLFLFQIQPIAPSFLGNIFSQNLVQNMLLSRHRFKKNHGLISMMKTEWRAFNFRKLYLISSEKPLSWVFLNWEFIFHYFRIYCLQKNLKPTQNSFAEFLTAAQSKTWLGEILRFHFKIANELRSEETFEEVNFVFENNSSILFIGQGKVEGKIGKEIILLSELTPQSVYHLNSDKIVLTKTVSLLSHGILAAIEIKIRVVAGIPDEIWDQLDVDVNIYLDFKMRQILIK